MALNTLCWCAVKQLLIHSLWFYLCCSFKHSK